MIYALRPPNDTSRTSGPGGPFREFGHPDPSANLGTPRGIVLAQEEVHSSLRKAKKMQVSAAPSLMPNHNHVPWQEAQAPPHLSLPHVLSAVNLSAELGLWPLYRLGIVVLGDILLSMEGAGMAQKAIDEVESVWDQVRGVVFRHARSADRNRFLRREMKNQSRSAHWCWAKPTSSWL